MSEYSLTTRPGNTIANLRGLDPVIGPSRPHAEISHEFPLASTGEAVAAAIRIEDRYFMHKLQPVTGQR